MPSTIYFASDAHFGAGSKDSQASRVARFVAWLDRLEDASHLYLLGDIFDFWLDYPTYMPKLHMEVLYALRRQIDRGVEVVFVGGNHDVWCEDFFRETLGTPILASGDVVEHQGRRLRLHHGDGLLSGDKAYRLFRAVVRHPVPVFLAKAIHPELLHRFAEWLSRNSRAMERSTEEEILEAVHRYGRSHDHSDVDHLVIGHIHVPCEIEFDAYRLTCLGDWIGHFTAARLRDGEFQLLRVDANGAGTPWRATEATEAPYSGR
jgi:UDP-2,3-diacylglucosamine hydrolase